MGVASAIMKKATPRRYKYNSEKNIRVTNVSVAIPFSIDIMSESLLLENEHFNLNIIIGFMAALRSILNTKV